ncbi:MAG: methyltransferase family protein [Gemmatimonadetes bacterium]|nr:methyltransferase family protein [Gemmatimonadota bacterium]
MKETSKTLRLLSESEIHALSGRGLDIGCGDDPVRPDVERFDVEQGDANRITSFITDLESFDYVFSSHCLEHMHDPKRAITEWWALVKPGGTLMVIVPDEDLYEQGYWPSLFNPDHKATFTISKQRSWSPVSCNLAELVQALPDARPSTIRLQDAGYESKYLAPAAWPRPVARLAVRVRNTLVQRVPAMRALLNALFLALRLPVDQTDGTVTAQNILVVSKRG